VKIFVLARRVGIAVVKLCLQFPPIFFAITNMFNSVSRTHFVAGFGLGCKCRDRVLIIISQLSTMAHLGKEIIML